MICQKLQQAADVVYVSTSDTAISDSFTFKVDDGKNDRMNKILVQVKDATATAGGSATDQN